jgi:GNAT superfamily N-acetyltransferase
MTTEITVRRAVPSDAATVAEMRVRSSAERNAPVPPERNEAFRVACEAAIEAELREGGTRVWLAFEGERAIGTATLMLLPTLPRIRSRVGLVADARDGRVRNVYVEPEYRRRGVAHALMREVLDEARRENVDRLTLGTSEMGRPVYEKLGFVAKSDEMIYEG